MRSTDSMTTIRANLQGKKILDPCCGSKMFWFDKANPMTLCFGVLARDGVLIFKWSEVHIKTSEILKLTEKEPLFGHRAGRHSNTHWLAFMNT